MGIAGKILIVDEEEDALENCRRILSRVPYACVSTSNPSHAFALLEREHPGLVLTDLRMPKMDGIEVLTAAKRADPNVQVVLVTAHATIETAVTSMRYGAFDYITKPFTSEELIQVVCSGFKQFLSRFLSSILRQRICSCAMPGRATSGSSKMSWNGRPCWWMVPQSSAPICPIGCRRWLTEIRCLQNPRRSSRPSNRRSSPLSPISLSTC